MKKIDKAAMVAAFLADMNAVDEAPSEVVDGDIQDLDRGLTTLLQACVDIAKVCTETDEEMDWMLGEYVELMYKLAGRNKP